MVRMSLSGLASLLFLLAAPAFAANIDLKDSSLPPDLSAGEVQLTVVVSNITEAQRTKLKADSNRLDNLSVIMSAVDTSTPLKFRAEDATEAVPFYLVEWAPSEYDIVGSDGVTTTDTFFVTIKESVGGKLAEKYQNANMELKISYNDPDGTSSDYASEKVFTLVREIYAINEAPAFQATAIIGSHKKLAVNWTHKTSVAVAGTSTTAREPKRINIYAIDRDAITSLVLKGKKFDATTGATADVVTCTYTAPTADSGDCVVCPENVYLDKVAIAAENIAGVKIVTAMSKAETADVTGLSNDQSYFVFMQWEPSGLKTSQCVSGHPSANLSIAELNGEGEAKNVDFRCFIATAAYGSPLHKDLRVFRHFRDRVLMTSLPGRLLVKTYYKVSPPLAHFIAVHPRLKAWTRQGLEHVADWLRAEGEQR